MEGPDLVIKDGNILTPRRTISDGVIAAEGGKISYVGSGNDLDIAEDTTVISARGKYVTPGFIDIHVNGGGGGDALDGTPEALEKMAKSHARRGTTAFVPTIVTAPIEQMLDALTNLIRVKENGLPGPDILGCFLEGPYLSHEQKGAHNPKHLREPRPEHYQRFLEYSQHILMMAVAPELPGALELGRVLLREGITPAIAHSNATYDETVRAMEVGFRYVVHLFSSLSTWTREIDKAKKYAGITETALANDELTVELIGDGKHVPDSLMKVAVKTKGVNNICLVTDAIRASGLGPGEYKLGDMDIVVEDGVAKLMDRTNFAGSVATMDRCVRNMMELGGLSLQDSLKTATVNPAKQAGVEAYKGSLVEGKDADIVICDSSIEVLGTIVGGEVIFLDEDLN